MGSGTELHIHKNTTCLLFWGCYQGTRPTDLHVYLRAKWSSLKALGCPVLQVHFGIRPFAKLSPAVSPTKSSFLEDPHLCICITAWLTNLVSGALAGVLPIHRLPVVTPQTSFNRTCHCSISGGQATGCSSSLDELLPCDEGWAVKWQWFPSSLTCIASLDSVGSLCLPLGRKVLSLVTEETLPSGVLNVCIHFYLWHTGNKAFIFCSEEQIVPLECWRANKI